jgi:hypothetical protein
LLERISGLLNALATLVIGIFSVFIMQQYTEVTKYQAQLQKINVTPIMSFSTSLDEGLTQIDKVKDTLNIYNSGAPLKHLTVEIVPIIVVSHSNAAGNTDKMIFVPMHEWYNAYNETHESKGLIRSYYPNEQCDLSRWRSFPVLPPGKGKHEFDVSGLQHFIRIAYTNLLEERTEDFYMVNENDYFFVPSKRGKEIMAALKTVTKIVHDDRNRSIAESQGEYDRICQAARNSLNKTGLVADPPTAEDLVKSHIVF